MDDPMRGKMAKLNIELEVTKAGKTQLRSVSLDGVQVMAGNMANANRADQLSDVRSEDLRASLERAVELVVQALTRH